MSGILEKFFQIAVILTIFLILLNVSLIVLGNTLLNSSKYDEKIFQCTLVSVTGTEDSIEQTGTDQDSPQVSAGNWDQIQPCIGEMVTGYNNILKYLFPKEYGLDGYALIISTIITAMQVLALAYIPFALISAWRGGGSP